MTTREPYTVTQEGWTSQGTGRNQTVNNKWLNELINWYNQQQFQYIRQIIQIMHIIQIIQHAIIQYNMYDNSD